MKLKTINYKDYNTHLPLEGKHILAQQTNQSIFVYQAFQPAIALYAVKYQKFGGSAYKFERMSWIKPNFLWMMYRAGWATKAGQEHILAIEIRKTHFAQILAQAVPSAYKAHLYSSQEDWKSALTQSEVRLQWDPDHDPYGAKLERRAIQLGLRGETLRQFATDWIISISDMTSFVQEQEKKVRNRDLNTLLVMKESIFEVKQEHIRRQLDMPAI